MALESTGLLTLIHAGKLSLMPTMASTSSAASKCSGRCVTAGRQGRGSRSIATGIGRSFYFASPATHRSFS